MKVHCSQNWNMLQVPCGSRKKTLRQNVEKANFIILIGMRNKLVTY